MPFVNIRIVEGVLGEEEPQKKAKISQNITEVISESIGIPRDSVWVVFEDIPSNEFYVGGRTVEARAEDG